MDAVASWVIGSNRTKSMRTGKGAKRNANDRMQSRGRSKVPAEVSQPRCSASLLVPSSQFLPLKNGIVLMRSI